MSERKLLTIRTVDSVQKHPNADALDLIRIGGWQCVSKLGVFRPGDRCAYIEIDSFVPVTHPAFSFLEKNAIKWNGKVGARIKTIKLRQELSQGLAVPLSEFPEIANPVDDTDYAELIGIEKWEKILPANLAGTARGNFPSFIRKTDQERVQNYWNGFGMRGEKDVITYKHPETGEDITYEKAKKYIRDTPYEVTIKLDGSSMTVYYRNGEFGVCSRNLDLVETENNTFWKVANRLKLRERMMALGLNIALQGELIGPGIQGNKDKLKEPDFYAFDVLNLSTDYPTPLSAHARHALLADLNHGDCEVIHHVPELETRYFDFPTIEDALAYADGPSLNHESAREGVVFKSIEDPEFSFKIISNKYLLSHGD